MGIDIKKSELKMIRFAGKAGIEAICRANCSSTKGLPRVYYLIKQGDFDEKLEFAMVRLEFQLNCIYGDNVRLERVYGNYREVRKKEFIGERIYLGK